MSELFSFFHQWKRRGVRFVWRPDSFDDVSHELRRMKPRTATESDSSVQQDIAEKSFKMQKIVGVKAAGPV
jgi:hypothetical protein